MVEIDTIRFKNLEAGDEALAVVRCEGEKVWLCLSSESNGDIELALDKSTTMKLLDALSRALRNV